MDSHPAVQGTAWEIFLPLGRGQVGTGLSFVLIVLHFLLFCPFHMQCSVPKGNGCYSKKSDFVLRFSVLYICVDPEYLSLPFVLEFDN